MGTAHKPELGRPGGVSAKEPRGPIIRSPLDMERAPVRVRSNEDEGFYVVDRLGGHHVVDPVCGHWAPKDRTCRLACYLED